MRRAITWAVQYSLEGRLPLPFRKVPLVVLAWLLARRYAITGRLDRHM